MGLHETLSGVNESFSSSGAYLLLLAIRGVEVMSSASILEGHVGALKSNFSSNNTRIKKLKSHPASKTLELNAATAELESTEHHGFFPEDAAIFMPEQVQSQDPQLSKVEAALVAAGGA